MADCDASVLLSESRGGASDLNNYDGAMICEQAVLPGLGGDLINAYLARPLGPGPYPAVVSDEGLPHAHLPSLSAPVISAPEQATIRNTAGGNPSHARVGLVDQGDCSSLRGPWLRRHLPQPPVSRGQGLHRQPRPHPPTGTHGAHVACAHRAAHA
jgi:hypothetical protein